MQPKKSKPVNSPFFLSPPLSPLGAVVQSEYLAAMLVSGAVHVTADSGGDRIDVVSNRNGYNDTEWHTVTITKRARRYAVFKQEPKHPPLSCPLPVPLADPSSYLTQKLLS